MIKADCVHSTPPTNTSALPDGLVQQQRERALRRVSKLRQRASDEIERLISFLDASDPYAATELEDAVDDSPCDGDADAEPSLGSFDRLSNQTTAWSTRGFSAEIDTELDDADAEPILAAPEQHPTVPYTAISYTGDIVVYGPPGQYRDKSGNQEHWASGNRDDREGDGCADDREVESWG